MVDLCRLIWCVMAGVFRSRVALHAEILVLHHQLNVLRRKSPKRLVFKKHRSACAHRSLSPCSQCAGRVEDSQTRNSDCVASSWFSSLLALEITTTKRCPLQCRLPGFKRTRYAHAEFCRSW